MIFDSKKEIKNRLEQENLLKIWPLVKNYVKPSIEIFYAGKNDEKLKIGRSKIGGKPDLPDGVNWPKFNNHTQSFIAQINLEDLNEFDQDNILPSEGILYFFYDLFCYDQENENGNGGSVIYHPETENLSRRDPPKNIKLKSDPDYKPQLIYKSAFMEFFSGLTLPYMNHILIENLIEKQIVSEREIFDNYFEKVFDSEDGAIISHRLLGYSENVQDSMESECYLIKNNLNWSNLTEKNKRELKKQWSDWILLFQFPWVPELDLEIHDGGVLYYWIHKNDLKDLKFDEVIVIMQCG